MKKIILAVCLGVMLIFAFSFSCFADGGTSPILSSLIIESYPEKTVYGAFEELDTTGLSLLAVYSNGEVKSIPTDQIQISYINGSRLRVGDNYVYLFYGGKSLKLQVTVNRISYDLSSLELNSITTLYNGRLQGYTQSLPKIVGKDGIPLQISTVGGGINAGVYDIILDFHTDSKDYLTPESRVVSLTVQPAEVEAVWGDLSFTYDGKSKSPSAYFLNVNGERVNLSVTGAETNAGENYTATAYSSDSNYKITNSIARFQIKKADYDMSKVKWNTDSFIYDGSKKSVSLSGLPLGVSVKGYSGDMASEAGKYSATATLIWDNNNYNSPGVLSHKWEILPADYDLSGFIFDSAGFIYDGEMHYPILNGSMPIGADGVKLQYSFSAGARHVSEGVVSVIISFKTDSKNYNTPKDKYSSVYINPLGIEVQWGNTGLTYNGEEQSPTAYSAKCSVAVSGGKTNAGRYTASAVSQNTDYYIINDSIEYTIEKAKNLWITEPRDSECYEGKEIRLIGKSRFGSPFYTFYSDFEGKKRISTPTTLGKYYARLTVDATENYDGLTSNIICFEIVPIVPVSFMTVISNNNLQAFNRLSSTDFICSVINNDGSQTKIDSSLVNVIYENGDSFRKSDKTVIFKYDKFTLELQVDIEYADYDLSNVKWKNSSTVYDGNSKSPEIIGLPAGIRVIEYVGANAIDAGIYTIYARVEYDSENYNEPSLPVCNFIIDKRPVSIPHLKAVYNGELIEPISDSPLYKVTSNRLYLNAGIYTVSVSLTDSNNYIFAENNASTANGLFEILPATIGVMVYDKELHLFEPLGDVYYKITSGNLFGSDKLSVSSYRDGDALLIRSENPNYILEVDAGKIIRLPYPTIEGGAVILCILFAIGVLIIMIKVLYNNRKGFATVLAMIKCKWHNRNMVVPDPKKMKGIRTVDDDNREQEIVKKITIESKKSDLNILDLDVDADRADMLITDSLAKTLIKKTDEVVYTDGNARSIINVDTISDSFSPGDRVDLNSLKAKGVIDQEVCFIKVLSRGRIDKPLKVYANDFSLSAVKMIALTGGQAFKVSTRPKREKD